MPLLPQSHWYAKCGWIVAHLILVRYKILTVNNKSYTVENPQGPFFLYWDCNSTNLGDCGISNWSKFFFNITSICTNLWCFCLSMDNAYKHLQELAWWCLGWWFSIIFGKIHGNGISPNGWEWRCNCITQVFGYGWKQV